MTKRHTPISFFLLALLLLASLAPGCSPRRIEASAQGFSGSGLANFSITVSPPLSLAATGKLTAPVPTDDTLLSATATSSFALFAEGDSGPVTRHAHIFFSELPAQAWRWELETWSKPEGMLYTNVRAGGKNWTIQMFPVVASTDWFSALWQKNGRQTPDLWLAKRWSSTPEKEMRLLAEYREPAPACMRDRLTHLSGPDGKTVLPKGKDLWRGCEKEINDFSARADTVFDLERRGQNPVSPVVKTATLPDLRPDMPRIAGKAELLAPFPSGD